MEFHASCAVRAEAGVLLLGRPGAGKSDLLLRLLDQGFDLVADDRVVVEGGMARARKGGEGLIEVRGIGILRLPYVDHARLRLAVRLHTGPVARLPDPKRLEDLDVPVIDLDPCGVSAAVRVRVAVDCLIGRVGHLAGFAAA